MARPPRIAVVGAGLAGSLLALALARRGEHPLLIDRGACMGSINNATLLSYGGVAGWGPSRHWRRLQHLHGDLGWRPSRLVCHSQPWPLGSLPVSVLALLSSPLPFGRVDPQALVAALPSALAEAGVKCCTHAVEALAVDRAGGWRLRLAGPSVGLSESGLVGPELHVDQVVLAAGAHCGSLWPTLPERLRISWAGVLAVRCNPHGNPWLEQVSRGHVVMPAHMARPHLEQQPPESGADGWVVDPGLAPWGKEGVLLGQISLVRSTSSLEPPDPELMEARLRQGLGRLDPILQRLEGCFHQVPVTFCSETGPLVGPVDGELGLWVFTGFSAAFSLVPHAAESLAETLIKSLLGVPSRTKLG